MDVEQADCTLMEGCIKEYPSMPAWNMEDVQIVVQDMGCIIIGDVIKKYVQLVANNYCRAAAKILVLKMILSIN